MNEIKLTVKLGESSFSYLIAIPDCPIPVTSQNSAFIKERLENALFPVFGRMSILEVRPTLTLRK